MNKQMKMNIVAGLIAAGIVVAFIIFNIAKVYMST